MEDVALLVLAGGQSERFGGIKALFPIENKPMIQHVVERTSSLSEELVISCKSKCGELKELFPEAKVLQDRFSESGPLVGLISSLPSIKSKYVALASCDNPKTKREVLEMLLDRAKDHSAAVPRWPNGYLEPLMAVYRKEDLMESSRQVWRDGKMKLSKVVKMLPDVVFVSTEKIKSEDPKLESFTNLNSPEDIKSAFKSRT